MRLTNRWNGEEGRSYSYSYSVMLRDDEARKVATGDHETFSKWLLILFFFFPSSGSG